MPLLQTFSMVIRAPEAVFDLLQLVALALPAIAIYLQVLGNVYSRLEKGHSLNSVSVASVTVQEKEYDFVFGVGSLLSFVASGFFLVLRVLFESQILVVLGVLSIVLAFSLFGLSAIFTMWHSMNELRG